MHTNDQLDIIGENIWLVRQPLAIGGVEFGVCASPSIRTSRVRMELLIECARNFDFY